jgi:hypothetical protein
MSSKPKFCTVCIDGGIPQNDGVCPAGKKSDENDGEEICLGKVTSAVAKVAELLLERRV